MIPSIPGLIFIIIGLVLVVWAVRVAFEVRVGGWEAARAVLALAGLAAFFLVAGVWFTMSPEVAWRSRFDDS